MAFCALIPLCVKAQEAVFPFPTLPERLTEPQQRLTYLLTHFWSAYDFADTSQANEEVGELGFAEFSDLLPHADEALQHASCDSLWTRIAADAYLSDRFLNLAELYLGSARSPMRNDKVYVVMLQSAQAYTASHPGLHAQAGESLRLAAQNQVGEKATDFAFEDSRGQRHSLYDIHAELTLIVFSDPECDHCRATLSAMAADAILAAGNSLAVLLINPNDNAAPWESLAVSLPAGWQTGSSPGGELMRSQSYYLPALPALYLLDCQKRVLVKDGTVKEVAARLCMPEQSETVQAESDYSGNIDRN